jgi:hypothetical protein
LCVQPTIERGETRKEDLSVTPAANTTRSVGGRKRRRMRSRKRKKTRGMTKRTMKMKARIVVANDKR